MHALFGQFGFPIVLSTMVILVSTTVSAITIIRTRRDGEDPARAARAMTAGAALLVVMATAAPNSWPTGWHGFGQLVLEIGDGGLLGVGFMLRAPTSLPALLLVGNILLYVPLGFFGALAWPAGRRRILLGAVLLSLSVEATQFLFLARVAATDDVILNVLGAASGIGLATILGRVGLERRVAPAQAAFARMRE